MFRKIIFISLLMGTTAYSLASERDDIAQVLKEIQYIKEVVKQLKKKHPPQGKIVFNYNALIEQLSAAEQGIKPYLNGKISVIHTKPPKPIVNPLYKVRKN